MNYSSDNLITTSEGALEQMHKLFPDGKEFTVVEHGYDNLVGLVDGEYAVRFPRTEIAMQRNQYEEAVLISINKNLKTHINIPRVLDEKTNPPCIIMSFLPGHHLDAKQVNSLSKDEQRQIAHDISAFAYELHQAVPVEEIREYYDQYDMDKLDNWARYFEENLGDPKNITNVQNEIIKKYHTAWKKNLAIQSQAVVHDDLHSENMMFANNRLVGVLDFSDTHIGSPEQELRFLFHLNEFLFEEAIKQYSKLLGQELSIEVAKTWAITQELATYVRRRNKNQTDYPWYKNACRNLNSLFPEGNWGK